MRHGDVRPVLSRLSEEILGPERLKFSLSWEMKLFNIFNMGIFIIWRRGSIISMQGFQCFYNYKDHFIYPCADIRTV